MELSDLRRRLTRLPATATALLGKLARTSTRERVELLVAQGSLVWAQILVWTLPEGRLVDSDHAAAQVPHVAPTPTDGPEPPRTPDEALAQRLALAIGRAAENGLFRPKCLVRSVALFRLLERRGIHGSRIQVGVRLRDGRFDAHAWVEYEGRVIGDDSWHVGQFVQLPGARVRARG